MKHFLCETTIIAISILIAVMLTIMLFLAVDGPAVEVKDFTVHEVPTVAPPSPSI